MGWQIAIDGPAASGKSTVSKAIAKNLGFEYLDTGAMYRAVTLKALRAGINLENEEEYKFLENTTLEFVNNELFLDGENVSKEIRQSDVTNNASLVSKFKYVREKLVDMQREMAANNNIIMDGRDIGTVVLPNANLKIFLTANVKTRAIRRMEEDQLKYGSTKDLETIMAEIEARDYKDSHREISPLTQAEDAILIDTSDLNVQEVIDTITNLVFRRGYSMKDLEQKNEQVEQQEVEETPVEEVKAEEVKAEEAPVEEAPAEDAPVEEAPVEEALADEASEEDSQAKYKEMQVVKGTVVEVQEAQPEKKDKSGNVIKKATEERVLITLADGQEGFLFRKDTADISDDEELFDKFVEGDEVEVAIKKIFPDGGKFIFSTVLVEKRQQLLDFEATIKDRPVIVAKVIKKINFGLLMKYEDFTCLLPNQLMAPREGDLADLVNKELEVVPIRVDLPRIRIIVSENHAINKKEKQARKEFLSKVEVGQVYDGVVKNIESYGAFIELGEGVEGLLHISEVDYNRISKIEKVLNTGDTVKVQVIKVEKDHIGLSRKALLPNYWGDYFADKGLDDIVTGTVVEIGNPGIRVNLATEIDGFIPKSEFSWEKELKLEDAVKVGDQVTGKLIEIEKAKKRIIISVKKLTENPWEVNKLQTGDKINVTVTKKTENGYNIEYNNLKGFLSKKAIRNCDPESLNEGDVVEARVNIFDANKQRFYVGLGENEPRAEKGDKNIKQANDKMVSTLGDFFNDKLNK